MLANMKNVITIKNTIVRARINKKVKEDARVVLVSLGLTFSTVLQMFLEYISVEKKLPPAFTKKTK
jgi:addiction module RelB/DinJ family antitoxin